MSGYTNIFHFVGFFVVRYISPLHNSYKLKGKNIYFVHDLCFEDRQEQRILRKHLNYARSKNYSAKIKGRNLIVNNEVYTVAQLENLGTDEDNVEINVKLSPLQRKQPNSAPQTPTLLQTFLDDSLNQLSYMNQFQTKKKNINTALNINKKENKNEDSKLEEKEEHKEGEGKQKTESKTEKSLPNKRTEIALVARESLDNKTSSRSKEDEEARKQHLLSEEAAVKRSSSDSVKEEITFCISNASLGQLRRNESFSQKIARFFGERKLMTQEEFEECAAKLYKCSLKSVRDLHELHLRRVLGMEYLEDVVRRAHGSYISLTHVIHLTWSVMSLIHHFQLRLKTGATGPIYRARERKKQKCFETYFSLIRLFHPIMHRIVLNAILTFYKEGKLWEVEFACTDLIVGLIEIHRDPEEGINDIVATIEASTLTIIEEARHLTVILYDALERIYWPTMSETIMKKFLSMLDSSIEPDEFDDYNYSPLRKGLEMCIKHMMQNIGHKDLIRLFYLVIKRVNDDNVEEALYCFGNLGVHAAKIYRRKTFRRDICKGPFPLIFGLFKSKNPLVHLLGVQIWQNLIDRHNNASQFLAPRIFFQECNYKLIRARPKERERAFFKDVRDIVYEIAMIIFRSSPTQVNLENTYQAIALTLIEIPCGYTASCYVTVAMSLQEHAFSVHKQNLVKSNHFHATVMSMMTLVCYIHNAKIFYSYVNTILEQRAEWAPHLNPPLKSSYQYAKHHILWNKSELFFEDWEARYGLWKCFRGRKRRKSK